MELPMTPSSMRPVEGWVQNRGVRLHYIHSLPGDPNRFPLVMVPGFSESCEDWLRVMSSLAPRGCVAISLRGRGKSDAPKAGYSFEDHVSDVEAVIRTLNLQRFCLMGFSRGVTFAIGCSLHCLESITGMVLIDFPARYHSYPPEWIDEFLSTSFGGKLGSQKLDPRVAWALQREAVDTPLSDRLTRFTFPVLVLHGGQPGSLIAPSAVKRYRQLLRNGKVVMFKDSGHDLREPDYELFISTLEAFLKDADRKGS